MIGDMEKLGYMIKISTKEIPLSRFIKTSISRVLIAYFTQKIYYSKNLSLLRIRDIS